MERKSNSETKRREVLIALSKTAAELRREYMKNWRKKNRDKVKQYNRAYWDRKAKKTTENNSHESGNEVNVDEN